MFNGAEAMRSSGPVRRNAVLQPTPGGVRGLASKSGETKPAQGSGHEQSALSAASSRVPRGYRGLPEPAGG